MSERSKRASTAAKSATSEAQGYLRELAKEDKAKAKAAVAGITSALGPSQSIADAMRPYMAGPAIPGSERDRYERIMGKPYPSTTDVDGDEMMGQARRRRKTKKAGRRKSKKAGRRSTRRRA